LHLPTIVENLPEKLVRVIGKVKKRYNITVRPVNMKDWDNEVARALDIYNDAWEQNWGFIPFSEQEVVQLAAGLKPVLDPRVLFFAERDGETVGFALNLPNLSEPLLKARPGPSIIGSYVGAARMILGKRNTNWVRVWGLGVRHEFRHQGIDALLYYETAVVCQKLGYEWAEASWLLETNEKMNASIRLFGGEVYREYRIYEKQL
jgi:GNAT superfamily N-acetyltransferase